MKKFKNSGGARIVELRELMKLSQKDFARKIGISQGALSQIESDRTQASFETIQKMNEVFNVNCNWLINGLGEVLLGAHKTGSQGKGIGSSYPKSFIPLIKEEAHAGYINGFANKTYLSQLDVYQIPGFEKGDYRLFEIVGDSMVPTLHPGEIVVCEMVPDHAAIENSTLCVLISQEGIVAKRIFQYARQKGFFILKSDNTNYKTQMIRKSRVLEAWTIKAKITTLFNNNVMDNKRLERLEHDFNLLKSKKSKVDELMDR
jgi:transcriptional regulator with XRE-family HTH domain